MNLETALRAYLIAGTTSASGRVYELVLPPTAKMPAITLQRISNIGHADLSVDFPRMQVSCWGSTPIQARQLADEVTALLHNFKGVLTGTWGSLRVKNISWQPSIGIIHDKEAGLIHIPLDFKVKYVKE